ncbi:hypothetical protein WJX74_003660 [Apatococcus lobatus]|uniref:Uncharacterized protein n=1 Tax=Apatococcus lobatus TaxID=904363 RepID=A0AAW1S637_9CHLO
MARLRSLHACLESLEDGQSDISRPVSPASRLVTPDTLSWLTQKQQTEQAQVELQLLQHQASLQGALQPSLGSPQLQQQLQNLQAALNMCSANKSALLERLQPTLSPSLRIDTACQLLFLRLLTGLQEQQNTSGQVHEALSWLQISHKLNTGQELCQQAANAAHELERKAAGLHQISAALLPTINRGCQPAADRRSCS